MSNNLTFMSGIKSQQAKNRDNVTGWKGFDAALDASDTTLDALLQRVKAGDPYATRNVQKLITIERFSKKQLDLIHQTLESANLEHRQVVASC